MRVNIHTYDKEEENKASERYSELEKVWKTTKMQLFLFLYPL